MTIKKHEIPACCGKKQTILETPFALMREHIEAFKTVFRVSEKHASYGILAIEDANLLATAPFGSNRLNLKCKTASCGESLESLERIIETLITP
jgi:hypothetical protein